MNTKILQISLMAIATVIPCLAFADPITLAAASSFITYTTVAASTVTFLGMTTATIATLAAIATFAVTYTSAKQMQGNLNAFNAEAVQRTAMFRQPITERRTVYGRIKVSGPIVFLHTTNNDDVLHLIVAIAGHEIDGYEQFYFNDEPIYFEGDPVAGLTKVSGGTYGSVLAQDGIRRGGYAKIRAYLGTSSQVADPDLISEASDKWTSNHRLQGIAYFYARLEYNREVFPQGIPTISCIVRGKKIYDPRSGSTGWTDNPALILRDYLTNTRYGLGASSSEVDDTRINAGANLADEIQNLNPAYAEIQSVDITTNQFLIKESTQSSIAYRTGDRVYLTAYTLPAPLSASTTYYVIPTGRTHVKLALTLADARAGIAIDITTAGSGVINIVRTGEPRYTANGTINTSQTPKQVIAALLVAQGASLSYSGGKFYLIPANYPTPTLTFDEDDLRAGLEVAPKGSMRDRFNQVKGTIVDPFTDWQPTDYPPITSEALATLDGETLTRELAFEYCTSPHMAQRLAKIALLDARQELTVSVQMKLTGMQAQVGDIIYLSNKKFGFTAYSEPVLSVSTASNFIEVPSTSRFKAGDRVTISSTGTLPSPLVSGTTYFVIKLNSAVALATTYTNAIYGVRIDLTTTGSGSMTLTRPTKAFRVMEHTLTPESSGDGVYLGVNMVLREADPSIYEWTTSEELTIDVTPNTNLPSPFTQLKPPSALDLFSGDQYLGVGVDGTVFPRIYVTWVQPPNSFALFYELGYKRSSDTTYTTVVISSSSTEYFIGPVQDGVRYDVRVASVNIAGMRSTYATNLSYLVDGKNTPPPDIESFSVVRLPDGTRRFSFSTANFPRDVVAGGGALIKYSTNLSATWDQMTQIRDVFRASPYETNELSAGTYSFGIKMIDSSGNESTNAHFITATLGDPRIREALQYRVEEDSFWSGTLGANTWLTNENTLSSKGSQTWASLPATWDFLPNEWSQIVDSTSPLEYETPVIDVGNDATFTPLVTANGRGTPTYTMKTGSSVDGGVTGSYVPVANVSGVRYIQIKVSMADTDPYITGMTTILDGEFVDFDFNDIDLSTYSAANFLKIGTGHFRLGLTNGAANISQAMITAIQSASPSVLLSNIVTKSATVGSYPAAEFKIFDKDGVLTDAIVDVYLKGPKSS
jgi:hypothetical protein